MYTMIFIMPYDFRAFAKFPTLFRSPCLWIVDLFQKTIVHKVAEKFFAHTHRIDPKKNYGQNDTQKTFPISGLPFFSDILKENDVTFLFAICQFVWD